MLWVVNILQANTLTMADIEHRNQSLEVNNVDIYTIRD